MSWLRVTCFLLVVPLATISHSQSVSLQNPSALPGIDTRSPRSSAAIGPLDRLAVTVFREPELSVQEVLVDESGQVLLPLVGPIAAAGKSTEVVAAEISDRLRKYLRDPQVSVAIKETAKRQITVAGSVVLPGVYQIEGRTTLLQAVALARGPSQVASLKQALIFRTINGRRTAAKFDLDAVARGKAEDPEVLAGDTIAMGSSRMKTAWRDVVTSLRSFNVFNLVP